MDTGNNDVGRPPYLKKDEDSKTVEALAIAGVNQTLIARIDCSIYHLEDKYLVTCHSSFEDYFKDRLQDAINL